jgi:hypothetical protein
MKRQGLIQGFSVPVFLMSVGFFYVIAFLAFQLVPSYYTDFRLQQVLKKTVEHFSAKSAAHGKAAEQFQLDLDRALLAGNLPALESHALHIFEKHRQLHVSLDYDVKRPWVSNIFVMVHFQHDYTIPL